MQAMQGEILPKIGKNLMGWGTNYSSVMTGEMFLLVSAWGTI